MSREMGSVCLRLALVAGLVAALGALPARAADETKEQRDKRMAWWREARFGLFIHWGLYAVPAGEWNGKKTSGAGEWIMHDLRVPIAEYEKFAPQFNPVRFDAREWVSIAKNAGMKYIVITSKHHDGFCLFDSKLSPYNIAQATPFKRDPLKELADECHKQGIRICWYHSVMDWHHPDYVPRRAWDPRPVEANSYPRYIDYMMGQLRELLTGYGEIGVIWFDGGWEHNAKEHRSDEVIQLIRSLQPGILINDRIQVPQDFNTPEQTIPATGIPGRDWETCMTMNDTWGFNKDDHHWKSTQDLLRKLIDIASKGGNFLLNVGPTPEGLIPQPSQERLAQMGQWLAINGEAIYGTQASPFKKLSWGRCTQKPADAAADRSGRLYLHVFDWPANAPLDVPGLKNRILKAYLLADRDKALTVTQAEGKCSIAVPAQPLDKVATVVVLEIDGPAQVDAAAAVIRQGANGTVALKGADASLHGQTIQYESGGGKDNVGYWTSRDDWVSWDLALTQGGEFAVEMVWACDSGSGDSEYAVTVGDQKLTGKVETTGSWSTFKTKDLGRIRINQAGRHTLAVKALTKPNLAVMNLQSITLKPVK